MGLQDAGHPVPGFAAPHLPDHPISGLPDDLGSDETGVAVALELDRDVARLEPVGRFDGPQRRVLAQQAPDGGRLAGAALPDEEEALSLLPRKPTRRDVALQVAVEPRQEGVVAVALHVDRLHLLKAIDHAPAALGHAGADAPEVVVLVHGRFGGGIELRGHQRSSSL